ncbi:biotin carboxyl carrier protein of acetyl-CoA carboxylase, chloroplastic-like isoform X2 [Zingiber officinale]|uniref:biotin carboxyl carrier protein of acetyl-CoA carboxylase, chloroplastic-like isoform X2 n=1 Tax=Zingiber officinale TaxID=94328 RepID=UPI001C4DD14B|nr:biotin carboxyl carrier protein of acetyl-CoA carboxylase, chloroplastic-like isoform X2 [Zingiber officinale]
MASISVPCPKCNAVTLNGSGTYRPRSKMNFLDLRSSWVPSSQNLGRRHFPILRAQSPEVALKDRSNSSPFVATESETLPVKNKDVDIVDKSTEQEPIPESTISAFMSEVSSLIELVDSKDITELHLKNGDSNQVVAAPAPALPPPSTAGSKSSIPPLKCPMAGTFYRCPAPGEPPFIKVGDKVQKGQVVCIIEAMKLMNDIEADKSGTVVEILAEDGKPVSVDMPLLVIQP